MNENYPLPEEAQGDDVAPTPPADQPENASAALESEVAEENSQQNEEVTNLTNRLVEKNEELDALNDKYLRLAAEFDNYKRRVQRDQRDTIRFANEKLFKDLLPTLDNLERALQSGREQERIEGLLEGVDLTYKHFLDTLQKMGIKQVTSVGEVFDPAQHQAVGQVESTTIPDNVVVDEYQKGYFLHDRIIRPAMVTVAKTKAEPGDGEGQESKEGAEA
ncbi:MAG: nucleotide exchange factor GrpE [Nitrospira sp.]|nr:nucleotide exchange factor GrpE [Nitrospira sp.]